jgi:hypothetical protein
LDQSIEDGYPLTACLDDLVEKIGILRKAGGLFWHISKVNNQSIQQGWNIGLRGRFPCYEIGTEHCQRPLPGSSTLTGFPFETAFCHWSNKYRQFVEFVFRFIKHRFNLLDQSKGVASDGWYRSDAGFTRFQSNGLEQPGPFESFIAGEGLTVKFSS